MNKTRLMPIASTFAVLWLLMPIPAVHAVSLTRKALSQAQLNRSLLRAVQNSDSSAVTNLLNIGADANAGGQKDRYGRSPLLLAAVQDKPSLVKLLVDKGANVNARDLFGDTALINMSYHGRTDVVRLLIKHGADVNAQQNAGATALILSSRQGHSAVVKLLLNSGAKVNVLPGWPSGFTALMEATWNNHANVVRLLLDKNADSDIHSVAGVTSNGTLFASRTSLEIAELNHNDKIADLLRDASKTDISVSSAQGIQKPIAEYLVAKSSGEENAIHQADLSPDGKLVACISKNGKLTVYAVGRASPLFTTKPRSSALLGDYDWYSAATFSADGHTVAFVSKAKTIEILSTRTGKSNASLAIDSKTPEGIDIMAFSPDGRKLAVSSGTLYHKNLRVFDTITGKLLGEPLLDVDGGASQLFFSPDGKRLIANHNFLIYLVDALTYRLNAKVCAYALSVFSQGDKLFAVQGQTLAIQELTGAGIEKEPTGHFLDQPPTDTAQRSPVISGSPSRAAVLKNNEVSIRNREGIEISHVSGDSSWIKRVCLSADGRVLLVYRTSVQIYRLPVHPPSLNKAL